ncbi:hypothetical protein GCM10007860_21420 [Chitiniphilus shinanonensis]|uniref:Uncharacterized protein n=1 Tax=Chitiniphilus shinanonensis TaxID=553088 RepID=A0ABQ6BTL2_9NEIS|nr:hypothetical protein [Chitiniphilus shinanonensis]GLS04993.1 hypothetical protein GCM10007860_21420 [Chitiniphilus shinanonensis]
MSSHFSSIGFQTEHPGEFVAQLRRAAEEAEHVPCPRGYYRHWRSEQGASLWIQFDRHDAMIGVTPCFEGQSSLRVGLVEQMHRSDDSPLEGACYGWAAPPAGDPHSGMFPFLFDLADAGCHPALSLPSLRRVHLSAFAETLQVHESDDAFHATQTAESQLATGSFIPARLLGREVVDEHHAKAMFSGHVLRAAELRNPLTGHPYHWLLVSTVGGEIDVVVDPTLIGDLPDAGAVVSGLFWLCGRLTDSVAERWIQWQIGWAERWLSLQRSWDEGWQ